MLRGPMRRISTKLTLAAAVAVAAVMSVHAALRIDRESETLRADLRRDHQALGHALAETLGTLFEQVGPEGALHAVEEADQRRDHVEVRWVPEAQAEASEAVRDGAVVTRVPVVVHSHPIGVIELRESLAPVRAYTWETGVRVTAVTVLTVAVCAALMHLAGWWILDRRLGPLVASIRRIGGGDLAEPERAAGADELAVLAGELDAMRLQLAEAREVARGESDARLAALDQLRHADRLATVGKLAAGVAHELGTPLNVVSARAKMIRTGESEGDEIADDARVIGEQTERMTRIIRGLLDFARIRAPRRAPVDVGPLVSDVMAMLRPHAAKAGVELTTAAAPTPVTASVDEAQLQQVLTNLVMNAIQAQPAGGTVRARVEAADGGARIEIADGGPGVPDAERARIFEPFFTSKDVGEGTGLGLSVVHGIVEEHGGTVEVSDAELGGACFTVWLPREDAS